MLKVFALFTLVLTSAAFADDSIFVAPSAPLPSVNVSLATLADSPTMREHGDEVRAAAEEKVDKLAASGAISREEQVAIKGWFKELPFKRIVDVELNFLTGLPDMVALCLEANPSQYVAIDACAGTMAFISSLSVHVASRFLHYVSITGNSGHEFGFGPKVGYRRLGVVGFDSGGGEADAIDAGVSAEWVYWFSRHFGLGLQLDAGAIFVVRKDPGTSLIPVLPNAKLSIGLSF